MGLSASKRVRTNLRNSLEFKSSCDSVYESCLSLAQHAFPGVKPYQLHAAAERLHTALSRSLPLISRWVPQPPTLEQVDRALQIILSRRSQPQSDDIVLDRVEFEEFATEVFVNAVVSNAGKEVLKRVPLGALGIAGIGAVVKPGKGILGAAIGVYALGVASSIYLSLDSRPRHT